MTIRIILVDDDALYREVMTADLEERGFGVAGFADGPALLAALAEGLAADLALVDWTLPQMSGLDLLRALRGRGYRLPVVFLTGRSRDDREPEALAAGAADFIDKTGDIDELVHKLGRIIGRATP